jgi:hypothetical protein
MSKLSKFQQTKCVEITEKLIKWPICSPFVEMVDPERDGAPDYFDYIKEPMALAEVKRKLSGNEYDSVQSWERDIDRIWKNAKTYNGDDTLFTHMAMEASLWFNQKMKRFPSTQEEDWTSKIQRTAKKLLDVLSHPPAELDPSGKLSAAADSGDEEARAADD